MKFLCVPCDEPMTLQQTSGPDEGSFTLVYGCDACGYEMAMLTNAHESQVVGSLGVKFGSGASGESRCPFTGVVQERTAAATEGEATVRWTAGAEQRLESIPSFIRPMARSGIEKFARDKGYDQVDETVLAEARSYFGM